MNDVEMVTKYRHMTKLLDQYAEAKEWAESLRFEIEEAMNDYPYEKFFSHAGTVSKRKSYLRKSYNHKDVERLCYRYGIPGEDLDEILQLCTVPPTIVIELNKQV